MAKPRIFVSSTYYDLKHIRASLENFIEELGYEAILSEKGDIAYAPDIALDQSCYREVCNSDVFVLIIGGRYGAEKSERKKKLPLEFYDRYDSITRQEYASAIEKDIPIYILIEKPVYADFETYLRNKSKTKIKYAHVDSVNIFHLIEQILAQPRNNPVYHFDKYAEIEGWLRDQWAGLFRELLSRMTSQQQLASLSTQVRELSEINKTLKTYLEQVVSKIAPEESAKIIKSETKRLSDAMQLLVMEETGLIQHLTMNGIPIEEMREPLSSSSTVEGFIEALRKKYPDNETLKELFEKFKSKATLDYTRLKLTLQNPESALSIIEQRRQARHHVIPRPVPPTGKKAKRT